MSDQDQQQPMSQGFEQVDADAVCEKCGTVNDEGTLLCKICGNNLRDQRARRMVQGAMPEMMDDGPSKFRLFTGLLVTLGLLIFIYLVTNLDKIESAFVDSMAPEVVIGTDFWTGENAAIYDKLWDELISDPTPSRARQNALDSPIAETSFNGRYVIVKPGFLDSETVLGEANVRRLGDQIHFVVDIESIGAELRGVAILETQEGSTEAIPVVRNSASVLIDGEQHTVMGLAIPNVAGGHDCVGESTYKPGEQQILAYRIR